MNIEYYIEFDGIDESKAEWWEFDNFDNLIDSVAEELKLLGGGHADIYDEDNEFIQSVEI